MGDRLQDRVALVTGAGRGIGRAIAVAFAAEGADLFICARTEGELRETALAVEAAGRRTIEQTVDIRDREAVNAMVRRALAEYGRIDVLANNAGAYRLARFTDYTPEDFDLLMKTNVYGTFYVTQAVLSGMIERRKGKVINIASTAGKAASRYQAVYNMTKHAIVGMTRCLALELAPFQINVNAICPGFTNTDMLPQLAEGWAKVLNGSPEDAVEFFRKLIPMGRLTEPEEIASLAVYLASSESDGMTGESIVYGGGFSMS